MVQKIFSLCIPRDIYSKNLTFISFDFTVICLNKFVIIQVHVHAYNNKNLKICKHINSSKCIRKILKLTFFSFFFFLTTYSVESYLRRFDYAILEHFRFTRGISDFTFLITSFLFITFLKGSHTVWTHLLEDVKALIVLTICFIQK